MGYKLDFVVDLVEVRVDLEDSLFSESIRERWYTTYVSQRKVVVLEFGKPCSPPSTLFPHHLNCHDQKRVPPFFHEVLCLQRWMFRFHKKNVFENYLTHFLC